MDVDNPATLLLLEHSKGDFLMSKMPAAQALFNSLHRRFDRHFDQLRLAYAVVGGLAAVVGLTGVGFQGNALVASLAFWALVFLGLLFAGLIAWIVIEGLLGKPTKPLPPRTVHRYHASPYIKDLAHPTDDEIAHVEAATAIAATDYSTDTIKPVVVRTAILKGAGIGIRIQDESRRGVGFVDIYHLSPEAHKGWVDGTLYERDLAADNFTPISAVSSQGSIDLVVGAISVDDKKVPWADVNTLGMAALGAATFFISKELARFRHVNLYASIYSNAGERYAKLLGFGMHKEASQRGPAANGHDMLVLSFEPKGRQMFYFSNNYRSTVMLTLAPS